MGDRFPAKLHQIHKFYFMATQKCSLITALPAELCPSPVLQDKINIFINFYNLLKSDYFIMDARIWFTSLPSAFPLTLGISSFMIFPFSFAVGVSIPSSERTV